MSEKEVYGVIYVIENKINGKKYVGQTIQGVEKRFRQHAYGSDGGGSYISRAIRKNGETNFSIEKIDFAKTLDELNDKEVYWIKTLNTLVPNGYNLTNGGEGVHGYAHSVESKKKISKASTGRIVSNITRDKIRKKHLGKKLTEDTKRKLREINTGKTLSEETKCKISNSLKKNPPFKGRHHTEDSKNRLRKALKGKRTGSESSNAVKVINITTGKVFGSIVEASKFYNIKHSINIVNACKGRYATCGGYQWAYFDDSIDWHKPKKTITYKKVINLDDKKVFESQAKAAEFYGIGSGHISCVCRGRRKTAGGYRWQYYEDYLKENT